MIRDCEIVGVSLPSADAKALGPMRLAATDRFAGGSKRRGRHASPMTGV